MTFLVVGTRPNFVKMTPIVREFDRLGLDYTLIHTGQHYDPALSDYVMADLGLPEPDLTLNVGSCDPAEQLAKIMLAFAAECDRLKPDRIVVVGDVTSSLACALVGAKKGIPVAHVEAGLRSFDRTMPEELNRVLIDEMSDLLFVTEPSGVANLAGRSGVHFVGNVMVDSLLANLNTAKAFEAWKDVGLETYAVLTLHRPGNVDDPARLKSILGAIVELAKEIHIVFSVHPRTEKAIAGMDLTGITVLPSTAYLRFLSLMTTCEFILTDSGGIQEEAVVLGKPCITLRDNTERPITVETGWNTLVGSDPAKILAAARACKMGTRVPELWDGHAAERIVAVLNDDAS